MHKPVQAWQNALRRCGLLWPSALRQRYVMTCLPVAGVDAHVHKARQAPILVAHQQLHMVAAACCLGQEAHQHAAHKAPSMASVSKGQARDVDDQVPEPARTARTPAHKEHVRCYPGLVVLR